MTAPAAAADKPREPQPPRRRDGAAPAFAAIIEAMRWRGHDPGDRAGVKRLRFDVLCGRFKVPWPVIRAASNSPAFRAELTTTAPELVAALDAWLGEQPRSGRAGARKRSLPRVEINKVWPP